MGFFTWVIFIIILAFVLFAAASWMLNWSYRQADYPQADESNDEVETEIEVAQRRRKWIGIFVLVATIVIMAITGINAFLGYQA
jgi:Na+/H+ antiporter NhaC